MTAHLPDVEFLTSTRIGEKGQLTVPQQFRKDLGLGPGAPFAVLRVGSGLILLPERERFQQLCHAISARLVGSGRPPERILATLPEARERAYARHYGNSRRKK